MLTHFMERNCLNPCVKNEKDIQLAHKNGQLVTNMGRGKKDIYPCVRLPESV